MKKYIVLGQTFGDDEDGRRVVKIGEHSNESEANRELASVRRSGYYEYEWIKEVEDNHENI